MRRETWLRVLIVSLASVLSACFLFGPSLKWDFQVVDTYPLVGDEADSATVSLDNNNIHVRGLFLGTHFECRSGPEAEVEEKGREITLRIKQGSSNHSSRCYDEAFRYEAHVFELEPGSYLFSIVHEINDVVPGVVQPYSEVIEIQ